MRCPDRSYHPRGRALAVHSIYLPAGLLAALLLLTACGGGHRLAEYDFTDRSVAVVSYAPAYPVLRTPEVDVSNALDDPLGAVFEAGSSAATEVVGRRARARLDSAAARVDVGGALTDRTLTRASRYLGGRPVDEAREADFLLEVDVFRFGIDARDPEAAYLFLDAEVVLLEARNGYEIWNREIYAYDRLTPRVRAGDVPTGVVTAGVLRTLSVEDFERVLVQLADFSSNVVTGELREALRDVRRERLAVEGP